MQLRLLRCFLLRLQPIFFFGDGDARAAAAAANVGSWANHK